MLSPPELIEALHDGLKVAEKCGNFCRTGIEIDEGRYRCWHNGTGRRDTDVQIVTSTPVLNMTREQLAVKFTKWIEGLHKGERPDLNATMETRGPAMAGWPWLVNGCVSVTATMDAVTWYWTDGTQP